MQKRKTINKLRSIAHSRGEERGVGGEEIGGDKEMDIGEGRGEGKNWK
jgi:hypothetical protein